MQMQNTSMQTPGSAERVLSPFKLLNGMAYFSGKCEECRPFCAAACCRGYTFVSLTEEEVKSGRYEYRKRTEGCECGTCTRMKELGIQYVLRKLPDGSCIYLDGTRKCSIYTDRPETCKRYSCVSLPFALNPA